MAFSYPGYEIERFEDEGGRCYIRLIPKSSVDTPGDDDNAGKEKRHEKHQESEAIRKAEG